MSLFVYEANFLDILEDIREECAKYGFVKSIEVPRSIPGVDVTGVGKVWIVSLVALPAHSLLLNKNWFKTLHLDLF